MIIKKPWEKFDPYLYIKDNYTNIHEEDNLIIQKLVNYYSSLPKLNKALEIGAGPNLYPVMAMLPIVRKIECIDYSTANITYLKKQLKRLDANWYQFWDLFNRLSQKYNIDLVKDIKEKVIIRQGDIYKLKEKKYDLSSMFFCAESITTKQDKFLLACNKFINSVKPGGYLVAAFMENSLGYKVGKIEYPSFPINKELINRIFKPETVNMVIENIPLAKQPLRPGYSGMILLTATKNTKPS